MDRRPRVDPGPARPVLVYDGDCRFCTRWVQSLGEITRDAVEYVPAARARERFPQLAPQRLAEAVQLVRADGSVTSGARAMFESLAAGRRRWLLRLYQGLPGFAPVSELVYRGVAAHRPAAAQLDRLLFQRRGARQPRLSRWRALELAGLAWPAALAGVAGAGARALRRRRSKGSGARARAVLAAAWSPLARGYPGHLPRWLFLRALGVTYLAAFASLAVQVRGLVGERGLLPLRDHLEELRERYGRQAPLAAPTLFWLDAGDRALGAACVAGLALSGAVVAGLAPAPALALLWLLYLSLNAGGQDFLPFQWDALLLETGLLAVLYAPPGLRPRLARERPPSRTITWLLRALLFRLVFSSGMAKRVSGDRSWRAATALQHHYQTQPLPTPVSFRMHHLPRSFHRLCVYFVWLTEVALPPLGLGTRRMRALAFGSTVLLQGLIALTGNYWFFNLLTAALAVPLLDDEAFPRRLRPRRPEARPWPPEALALPVGATLLALGAIPLAGVCRIAAPWPARLLDLYRRLAPLHCVNSYGLFAVMTTERPEIVVEGSADAREWRPYEFRWKPGEPRRGPRFTGLHLPRLDWLLWFAALSPATYQDLLLRLLQRLREGEPVVKRLLASDPFPDSPPRYVRARLFAYQFASPAERRRTGAWWRREYLGDLAVLKIEEALGAPAL